MSDPGWEQVRELFLDLAELGEDERGRELARLAERDPELAGRVEDLLRHDRDEGDATVLRTRPPVLRARPTRFGPYEAVRLIGRGGMGEVYVARRADGEYDREVAVKLLREGTANQDVVARFLRERQALARLDHEYIARLLDGGTTETGEPYLVMEYVEGEPADVFASRLELRERLELFVRIGRAVTHAHERGFVHRDLKPSNILVREDGTPRLLDFGIARVVPEAHTGTDAGEPLTRTGFRLFTPQYASPEQVQGETATAQSDVFALGVVLYGFLCGRGPWPETANQLELELCIVQRDPSPPSRHVTGTTRSRISGDLDAIALQCLAKRPRDRYASVAELCDDIERHLAGLPILARRTSVFGRAVRFSRRRPAVPVIGALLIVALVATVSRWQSEARAQRQREELASSISGRIAAARTLFSDGRSDEAIAELETAILALDELPGEVELLAEALVERAVCANLSSDHGAALALLERAGPILDEVEAPDPRLRAKFLLSTSYARQQLEPGDASLEAARAALEHARESLEPSDPLYADALLGWAAELQRTGRPDEALAALGEAVHRIREADPKTEQLNRFLNEYAIALSRSGHYDEAIAAYEESLEIIAWHRGERHPSFPKVRLNLGTTYFRQGRLKEAKEQYESSLAGARLAELDLHVAVNLQYLGRIHSREGDQEAAEAAALEAREICERIGVEVHANRARCLLGIVYARSDRADEARELLVPLFAEPEPAWLRADFEAVARRELGELLDGASARPHLERALALERDELGLPEERWADLAARLDEER